MDLSDVLLKLDRIAVALETIAENMKPVGQPVRAPRPARPASTTTTYPQSFEAWWGTYPRREGKLAAYKAWAAAAIRVKAKMKFGDDSAIGFLISKAKEFAAAFGEENLQYCPHPATWLNQERFYDDQKCWGRYGPVARSDESSRARASGSYIN